MDIKLSCRCGSIKGVAHHITPQLGSRIVCFCDDCQEFADYIDDQEKTLDDFGGTEIYQLPINHVEIIAGQEQLKCMHLKPKGLHRWYAGCCNTPLANTMGANMPFIGLIHNFIDDKPSHDIHLGPILGYLFSKNKRPADHPPSKAFSTILRIIYKILLWRIKKLNRPSSFFDNNGHAITDITILHQ